MTSSKSERGSLSGIDLEAVDRNANEHRYDRVPAKVGRVRALDNLHTMLVANARLYRGELQDQRDAVTSSLVAIQEYLADQGFALPTLEPLMRPVSALVERELSILDPLFVERPRSGRPKRSLATEDRTGAIAAIAEIWLLHLKDVDHPQEQKLRQLAREISGGWLGEMTYAKIKNARETVSHAAKNHPAVGWANIYRRFLHDVAAKYGAPEAIELCVRNVNRFKPKTEKP